MKKPVEVNELKLIEDISILFEKRVILYGAGNKGAEAFKELKAIGIQNMVFCDGDMRKWGTEIDGTRVIPLQELKRSDTVEDIIIIITPENPAFVDQILNGISILELKTVNVFTKLALDIAIFQNIYDPRISEIYRDAYIDLIYYKKLETHFQISYDKVALLSLSKDIKNENNVIVFQPGKVGSSTVANSLTSIGVANTHIHFMSELFTTLSSLNDGFYRKWINNLVKAMKEQKKVKIITMVREPIGRDLAHAFHNLTPKAGRGNGVYYTGLPGDSFVNKYIANRIGTDFDGQFTWFDRELKSVFGVDVFEHPFDKDKGYALIRQANIEVLIMKLEKLNSLEATIGDFVNAPHFKLIDVNIGENKLYKFLYRNVKNTIKIPRNVMEKYYNDAQVNHFYSEAEIAGFWKKWESNISDAELTRG